MDQLVTGLKSKTIKADLLKVEKPTLENIIKRALAAEAANKGAEELQEAESKPIAKQGELHKVNTRANVKAQPRPLRRMPIGGSSEGRLRDETRR